MRKIILLLALFLVPIQADAVWKKVIQMSEMIVKFHHDERGIATSWDEVGKLVRCKDCKHWVTGKDTRNYPNPYICSLHSFMHGFERSALPEDYCSWAELRGDSDEIN